MPYPEAVLRRNVAFGKEDCQKCRTQRQAGRDNALTAAFVLEKGSQLAPCRPFFPAKPTRFQSGGRSPVLGNAVERQREMAGRLAEPHSREPCAGIPSRAEILKSAICLNGPTPAQHKHLPAGPPLPKVPCTEAELEENSPTAACFRVGVTTCALQAIAPAKPTEFQSGGRSPVLDNAVERQRDNGRQARGTLLTRAMCRTYTQNRRLEKLCTHP
jgi:hypothetical protein